MVNDQELTTLAVQELTRHHEHGREPGDPRSHDLSNEERSVRQDALADLYSIRRIVMHHYGRYYKNCESIALEVAAERSGISPDDLVSFRKHQPRHSAS